MNTTSSISTPDTRRIPAVDIARGLALLAMAIYHFAWDLEFFGYASPGTTLQAEWKYFARAIASSFLLLVGISLFLGHEKAINYQAFGVRLIKIALAATLISITTWLAMPGGLIFFGILHSIALGSVFALAFVRLPWIVCLAAGLFFIAGPYFLRTELLAHPAFYWLGLAPVPPVSNDYVPMFPWLGPILIGIALAKLAQKPGFASYLGRWKPTGKISRALTFFSKHSLLTYLIHQPLLLGLIYVFVAITGGPDRTPAFTASCKSNCSITRDAIFCKKFCSCVVDDLKNKNLWSGLHNRQIDINSDPRVSLITKSCSAQAE